MIKKIEWLKRGMTANNGLHMQEICDQIADATGIENSLQKPETAPSATQIVAVDNTNAQKMLTIGEGLNIENDTLKASGGSDKLYNHIIYINSDTNTEKILITLTIITKSNEIFTYETLKTFLTNRIVTVNGFKWENINNNRIYFINEISGDEFGFYYNSSYVSLNNNTFTFDNDESRDMPTVVEFIDNVFEI